MHKKGGHQMCGKKVLQTENPEEEKYQYQYKDDRLGKTPHKEKLRRSCRRTMMDENDRLREEHMHTLIPSKEIAEDGAGNSRNIERKQFKSGLFSILRIGRKFALCIAVSLLCQLSEDVEAGEQLKMKDFLKKLQSIDPSTYLPSFLPTYLPTYSPTHTHTHLPTYITTTPAHPPPTYLYSRCSHLEHKPSVAHFISLRFLILRQSVRLL
jgi:hypothetical protein